MGRGGTGRGHDKTGQSTGQHRTGDKAEDMTGHERTRDRTWDRGQDRTMATYTKQTIVYHYDNITT